MRGEFDEDMEYDDNKDDTAFKTERNFRSSRGRGSLGIRRGGMYMSKSRGRGGYGVSRSMMKSYISDDDILMDYDQYPNYKYPNVIFHVNKFDQEDRNKDEAIINTITHNFLKESLVEPLVVTAPKAP